MIRPTNHWHYLQKCPNTLTNT